MNTVTLTPAQRLFLIEITNGVLRQALRAGDWQIMAQASDVLEELRKNAS